MNIFDIFLVLFVLFCALGRTNAEALCDKGEIIHPSRRFTCCKITCHVGMEARWCQEGDMTSSCAPCEGDTFNDDIAELGEAYNHCHKKRICVYKHMITLNNGSNYEDRVCGCEPGYTYNDRIPACLTAVCDEGEIPHHSHRFTCCMITCPVGTEARWCQEGNMTSSCAPCEGETFNHDIAELGKAYNHCHKKQLCVYKHMITVSNGSTSEDRVCGCDPGYTYDDRIPVCRTDPDYTKPTTSTPSDANVPSCIWSFVVLSVTLAFLNLYRNSV